ncbi:MAG: hypothetical protein HEQ32_09365 [Vampirovibrio sp.]
MQHQQALKSLVKRCIFGFNAELFTPDSPASQLADAHPLGYIFFRPAFDACHTLADVQTLLKRVQKRHESPLFLGLDQEGGQVERLPSALFYGGISPSTLGEVERLKPEYHLAERYYQWQAQGLSHLGFNLNFFPTVDAHLNERNPIIGNRAFSSSPAEIQRLARVVLDAQGHYGIQSVLKHYPGHGQGDLDSHLRLPTIQYHTAEVENFIHPYELSPNTPPPWMMLAHAYYPALQGAHPFPASADPRIATDLLRHTHQFQGISISDDLSMQGLLDAFEGDQTRACLAVLNAGVDVLLFREAGPREWQVLNHLATALCEGQVNKTLHEISLERLQRVAPSLNTRLPLPSTWHKDIIAFHEEVAEVLTTDYKGALSKASLLVLEPPLEQLPHYAPDAVEGSLLQPYLPQKTQRFNYDETQTSFTNLKKIIHAHEGDILVLVRLPHVGRPLLDAIESWPGMKTRIFCLNIGTPTTVRFNEGPSLTWLNLGGGRPLTLKATMERLLSP